MLLDFCTKEMSFNFMPDKKFCVTFYIDDTCLVKCINFVTNYMILIVKSTL